MSDNTGKCYAKHHKTGEAKVGDVVCMKSRPDIHMHIVFAAPNNNYTAGHAPRVKARYMKPDGSLDVAEFRAEELFLK
jgi:hypothetical protein